MALDWPEMPRINLSPIDFNNQLSNDGRPTRVRRGAHCDCYDPETRRPDESCFSCAGWGFAYPVDRELADLLVMWTSFKEGKHNGESGTASTGNMAVTWPSTQVLGYGDIFVHPIEESVYSELLTRGEVSPTGSSVERLLFENIVGIELVRSNGATFTEGVDFNLVGQQITWLGGLEPEAGALYTVRYTYRAQYIIVEDGPKIREDTGDLLVFTAQVARFAAVNRQEEKQLGQM